MTGINTEGQARLRRWLHAVQELERAERNKRSAEVELANAQQDLGKWVAPPDLKNEERCGVWVNDGTKEYFLEVVRTHPTGDFAVALRPRDTGRG